MSDTPTWTPAAHPTPSTHPQQQQLSTQQSWRPALTNPWLQGYEGYGAYGGGGGYGGYPGYGAPEAHGYYAQPREPMPARAPEDPYARQGFPVNGPAGWVAYRTPEGEVYFHNFTTNNTQWERPVEWPNAPM